MQNYDDQHVRIYQEYQEPRFYSRIPNIIFQLGLKPAVIAYYCLLKRIAGDGGECYKRKKILADMMNCGTRVLQDYEKELQKNFKLLNGKSLIHIIEGATIDNGTSPNHIRINNIWPENNLVMERFSDVTEDQADEKIIKEIYTPAESAGGGRQNLPGGSAESADNKNNPIRRNHDFYDHNHNDIIKENHNDPLPDPEYELDPKQTDTFEWLKTLKLGTYESLLKSWAYRYSRQEISRVYNRALRYNPSSIGAYINKSLEKLRKSKSKCSSQKKNSPPESNQCNDFYTDPVSQGSPLAIFARQNGLR